ncbi:unnamed protein product [Trichobilharzia szidati]|nr:unnamed protein product [Trichobilharzia szidati]
MFVSMLSLKRHLLWIFKRSKKSIVEQLEEIDDEILELESERSRSIDSEKQFAYRLILYAIIIFGLSFIFVYYNYWPQTLGGQITVSLIFALYLPCMLLLKYFVRIIFTRRVNRTNEKLKKLRATKQKLLDDVREKEPYNKAQQILKRFDPLTFASIAAEERKLAKPGFGSMINLESSQSEIRRRNTCDAAADQCVPTQPSGSVQAPAPRLLRPLLPRERSLVDKLLDLLVGDGPDKRFALICGECAAHNGMALEEEFEYLAFRCCYCNHFNPARRSRLQTSLASRSIGNLDPVNSQSTPCLLSEPSPTGLLETMAEEVTRISGDDGNLMNEHNDDGNTRTADVPRNAITANGDDNAEDDVDNKSDSNKGHLTNGFTKDVGLDNADSSSNSNSDGVEVSHPNCDN